ncbi:major facilitator superfamily domain-containing protein [Aspergillus flavus]|uniref:Major facilitator superfamily domain-containing protein n=1 Tax=Aspergillus flavus (strain ATCC 200026 / FGSC A1120 / IAM 13836 / NRRL 3357 / JCM 12722 / SRRC 167) TaxID=332952 RepID=A0A7U2MYE5_ASPFN|nr:major facilitator superfamily domain-containing protein [Aspergillus flavus]
METIRDSAFGKLVRFFSGYRLLLYPEEIHDVTWRNYLGRPEASQEESMTPDSEEFYELHALYTVVSQASRRRRRRPPLKSVLAGPWRGTQDGSSEVIGWSDAGDMNIIRAHGLGMNIRAPRIVFVFFQFGVIYAKNIGMLLAFRFITGFMGSPVLATGGVSIRDMWDPTIRDYIIAIWASFAIAAPVLSPLVEEFAASISGFALVFIFFFLPETFTPNILSRRARRIRRIKSDQRHASEAEIEIARVAPRDVLFEALVPFLIVFEEKHGFNLGETGLVFLSIMIGAVFIALPVYSYWKYRWQSRHINPDSYLSPEEHLPPACLEAIYLSISLFYIHWIVSIITCMLFIFRGYLIFNGIFCYETQGYPMYAASVLAGNDFLRLTFGGGFPLFAMQMFYNLSVGWACMLLGCLTVLFAPYPFLSYRYGERIRMRSKYAQHGN